MQRRVLCFHGQILDGQLTDKYHEVQQRVGTKAKAIMDAKKRAERLREEATKLLTDAQRKLHMLAGGPHFLYVPIESNLCAVQLLRVGAVCESQLCFTNKRTRGK